MTEHDKQLFAELRQLQAEIGWRFVEIRNKIATLLDERSWQQSKGAPANCSAKLVGLPDRVVGEPLTTFSALDDLIKVCENIRRAETSRSRFQVVQAAIERAKRSRLTATGDGETVMQSTCKEPKV